ncbi:protein PHOTOPERIOD-INDEPENDENT EARLY FLOWERING 1 [Impatiens glandulifera]|uniref:protein PHOTOPERIOD-INDEPENDENT EARLY FLOWERING 1 n=1 Tax=Impatiens glandulifera TaxID=253017 RepID=UPI001FB14342|nr:protein PHOTOPERIOD-INDEPENDENT EARLY FLOWERING 1 [Impatiens glandulifera]
MSTKGPRPKADHETRVKRQKALEACKEPRRPKTHWDHVLEEMVWLSKDFESERKWKLVQAKKVALRASRGMLDQATRGEKKAKEEEQRLRKVALNISKDVKKFWTKIEKLVLYKHQLAVDEKKKKTLDKQLEFLLGQTERYSTMLAENLVYPPCIIGNPHSDAHEPQSSSQPKIEDHTIHGRDSMDKVNLGSQEDDVKVDEDFHALSEDEIEDDWHTLEEDEALITEEERKEELEALQNEVEMPLEELLKRYNVEEGRRESDIAVDNLEAGPTILANDNGKSRRESDIAVDNVEAGPTILASVNGKKKNESDTLQDIDGVESSDVFGCCGNSNGILPTSKIKFSKLGSTSKDSQKSKKIRGLYDFHDEQEDDDFVLGAIEDKDDETTLSEEEHQEKNEAVNPVDEISLLQLESEIPLEDLLARYREESAMDEDSEHSSLYDSSSEDLLDPPLETGIEQVDQCSVHDSPDEHGKLEIVLASTDQEEVETDLVGEKMENENMIADAAAAARSAQPTGNTFSTTKVRTKLPFFLKYPLREYQHIGLDWLVTMYMKRLNGILADEMGLGKTIMTIALLAHLACEKGIWGPHLIVVPTSVMLNWETEFLKWCPAFKILTYFGSAKERKFKRQGWMKLNSFHVCITTYRLVIQDSKIFKRKKWKYLILDEAHLIKNWKSQRWQTLLNFNSKRRILLTGTPLQNDLMELWSLMHFLMPHVFQSHQEFKDWFCNPISGMVEGQEKINKEVIDRLHNVLRPFILRRMKRDVEKQLPMKIEHVINCRLSRRQRNLYEDFIASSETQATLASANFFGMISVIMQLRKVCNHPDLFEGRPIVSSFDMDGINMQLSSLVCSVLTPKPLSEVDLQGFGFLFTHLDFSMTSWESGEVQSIATPSSLIEGRAGHDILEELKPLYKNSKSFRTNIFEEIQKAILEERLREAKERAASVAWWNSLRCKRKPIYSTSLRDLVMIGHPISGVQHERSYMNSSMFANAVLSPVERMQSMIDQVESFMFAIPAARASTPHCWCSKSGSSSAFLSPTFKERCTRFFSPLLTPFRPAIVRRQLYFPDRRLIQFDCGKLQELAVLLRRLKSEGHRALIFTQMTKMLDILEAFINLYGYTYMRLDGSTQPEERQTLMQRFNTNPKYFLFILSTRSGGVGINLVGADTVIFYDSDWNPAMDQQAQDRCHRIGQTREVHIYRLISQSTIEENILKKANQKRALDDLVIQSGSYNTEFFKKLDPMELFSGHRTVKSMQKEKKDNDGSEIPVSHDDLEAALMNAEDEADYMALKKVEQEEAVDNQEFTEEAIGKLEDDELINEDETKAEEAIDLDGLLTASYKDNEENRENNLREERALTLVVKDDDADMLADVKEMAAAAATAEQAILSLESQLRPIDRYAVRFLELWDPIINKEAIESEIRFEEREWELDRLDRLKEEMEAEIDDEEQPLVYEKWDAEFATKAYRQQVEILTQNQLLEDLENEAKEKERMENEDSDSKKNVPMTISKPKSRKRPRKPKFKSLKKSTLVHEIQAVKDELPQDTSMDTISTDDDVADVTSYDGVASPEIISPNSNMEKKRKIGTCGDAQPSSSKSKKLKKTPEICSLASDTEPVLKQLDKPKNAKSCESAIDVDQKPTASKSRMGGKVSITFMPVKRVWIIRQEKLKRKNIWSRDCFPSPDLWMPQEDSVLCSIVDEYGPQWCLASEILYGMTAGGFYRGRFRHPVHCCERFRELVQRHILSVADNVNNEKSGNTGPAKSILRVTEDNARILSDITTELPDNEPLLQKHFLAVLSSVWKSKYHRHSSSHRNGFYTGGRHGFQIDLNHGREHIESMKFTDLKHSSRLVAAALDGANSRHGDGDILNRTEESTTCVDQLELTLEMQEEQDESTSLLPSMVHVLIRGPESSPSSILLEATKNIKSSHNSAENQFRHVPFITLEGGVCSNSIFSASQTGDLKHRTPLKSPLGKPSKSKLRKALDLIDSPSVVPPDIHHERFDRMPPLDPFVEMHDIDALYINNYFYDQDDVSVSLLDGTDWIQQSYDPGFITGLEDYSSLPEFADIG